MPNDPQWGKKNNEGPPDLDEILRKLQQKIAGWLGFSPRSDAPRAPGGRRNAMMGGGIVLVAVLVIAVWLVAAAAM